MSLYNLIFRKVTRQAAKSKKLAVGAARTNTEIYVAAQTLETPSGTGVSVIVAVLDPALTVPFTVRYPVVPPSETFVAVVRYVSGGVTYRYKLWEDIGEVLPLATYVGETLPAGTKIEIWSVPGETATIPNWTLKLGLLELPSHPAQRDGTQIVPAQCLPGFASGNLFTVQLAQCAS